MVMCRGTIIIRIRSIESRTDVSNCIFPWLYRLFLSKMGISSPCRSNDGAQITYANGTAGHYILTTNKDGSHINHSHHKDEENIATEQTPAQLLYNVRDGLRLLPNLETFLANSGIIHLVAYDPDRKLGDAYISEVMWGTDASQEPVNNSNWIEIRNGTSAAIGIDADIWALWFYEAHETPATEYRANSAYEGPKVRRAQSLT